MLKLAILQPSYIPWIGYFEQIMSVDVFVFYDDVQYTKNDWRNRNRIKTKNGAQWLTVPVFASISQNINEVEIDNTQNWRAKQLQALRTNYAKSPFFKDVFLMMESTFKLKHSLLSPLCIDLIKLFCGYLEIKKEFYLSSELRIIGDKNERLLNFCRHFGATQYYSGKAASDYLDVEPFFQNGIEVVFQDFKHIPYPQNFGGFLPYMSIIDLLFNCGKESTKYIKAE